ncbi:MAG: pyridoxal phosphate-dependent transferase [Olpidium bornovanus]|uniref:Aspartate aminotransferase n=1 Tax=Olpidium bornovanus TaxID=278681 RepID=A0A8H7ZS14_9FUNG|nr:MAG: pyridoxal phosphate-dependent transferase [Olpidium bornovanus]
MLEKNLDKEYCPISGIPEFVRHAAMLAYGEDSPVLEDKRLAIVQSISGTGALRVAGEFIQRHYPKEHFRVLGKRIYIPVPTWPNHKAIFADSDLEVHHYRYCDSETIDLDFAGMYEDIAMAPNHSIVLLHACAHNPTGIEPTPEQWKLISDVIKSRKHFVLFDMAYQGFASGDFDRDAAVLRQFVADGHNVGLCQSFAKNMGLYGERVGALSFVCRNESEAIAVVSQLKLKIRSMYSSPPIHGARVAAMVMGSPELRHEWLVEVKAVCSRIILMREQLRQHLIALVPTRNWDHITRQIGMFCFTGLDADQCRRLTYDHSVYLTEDGRISMAGINRHNVRYVAEAIAQVIVAEKSGQELGELEGEDRFEKTIQPSRRWQKRY